MADFEIPLEERGVDDGFGEFVAHAGGFEGAGWDQVVVGAVGEGAALSIWRAANNVWDVGSRELELGLLFEGWVGGGGVGAEGVEEILFVLLGDFQGKWC